MLFRDLSEQIIKESIAQERDAVKEQYHNLSEKLLDFYEDRQMQDKYLTDYGFKKKDKTTDLPISSYNITRKVIDKISLVYKNAPERMLKDQEDDAYNQWVSDNPKFNLAMKKAERYKNLLGKILFRPHYKDDKWVFFIETMYEAHFLEGDPLNPVAYSYPKKQILSSPENVNDDWWVFWSDEFYFFYIPGTKKVSYDPNYPDGVNPFGIIPFVELRDDFPVNQYDCSGAVSLISANENINIAMNDLNLMIHFQAFDQQVVKGVNPSDIKGKTLETGPNKLLVLGTPDADLSLLGYNPKIMECIEAIKFNIQTIGWTYNLSINWSVEGNPASGFSLMVQNIDLIEAREDDVEIAEIGEKEIYNVLSKMVSFHSIQPKLPEDAVLLVNFADIDFPVNQKEQLDERDWYISHNIKTPLDYMDADLDEAEKLAKFYENKKLNGSLTAAEETRLNLEDQGVEFEPNV